MKRVKYYFLRGLREKVDLEIQTLFTRELLYYHMAEPEEKKRKRDEIKESIKKLAEALEVVITI